MASDITVIKLKETLREHLLLEYHIPALIVGVLAEVQGVLPTILFWTVM